MKYEPGKYASHHLILSFDYKDKFGNRYHTLRCGNCGKTFQAIAARVAKANNKHCTHCYHDVHKLPNREDPAWISWARMLQRVRGTGPAHANKNYKDRGITVCQEWYSYDNFFADMGPRPNGHSLDRIDVNGNYCKENCRWATRFQQQNNTRNNYTLTYEGTTKTLAEWSKYLGVKSTLIRDRLKDGWSVDKALTTPVKTRKNRSNQANGVSTDGRYGK